MTDEDLIKFEELQQTFSRLTEQARKQEKELSTLCMDLFSLIQKQRILLRCSNN